MALLLLTILILTIENRFISFYTNLWTNCSHSNLLDVFNALPSDLLTISVLDWSYLIRDISCEELYATACKLLSGKSPGPDGFNAKFYRFF